MKNRVAMLKKIKILVLIMSVLYFALCVYQYLHGAERYKNGRALILNAHCYHELQRIYGAYTGPYRDENAHGETWMTRVYADVYFPNMAPQAVFCSLYLDHPSKPLSKETKLKINVYGPNYYPKGFFDSKRKENSERRVTLGELDEEFFTSLHSDLFPKPQFFVWF